MCELPDGISMLPGLVVVNPAFSSVALLAPFFT
jgi:hypothetical protein